MTHDHEYKSRSGERWMYSPSNVRELVYTGMWRYCINCGRSEGMIKHMRWSKCQARDPSREVRLADAIAFAAVMRHLNAQIAASTRYRDRSRQAAFRKLKADIQGLYR